MTRRVDDARARLWAATGPQRGSTAKLMRDLLADREDDARALARMEEALASGVFAEDAERLTRERDEARADAAMAHAERDAAVSMGTQMERERDKASAALAAMEAKWAPVIAAEIKRRGCDECDCGGRSCVHVTDIADAVRKVVQGRKNERARVLARLDALHYAALDSLTPEMHDMTTRFLWNADAHGCPLGLVWGRGGRCSGHETGEAFDVAFSIGEQVPSDPALWECAGRLGEAAGLLWGGRWGNRSHFEAPWRALKLLDAQRGKDQ